MENDDLLETSSRISSIFRDDDTASENRFIPFMEMEELYDKLKLLNYDEHIRISHLRSLNRHYFALQTNSGEQFFTFISVAAWLVGKCGKNMETPQEHDDPNSVIATILEISRQLNIPVDFPPNKLKQGFGKHVILVLNGLADKSLDLLKFKFNTPIPPNEEIQEEEVVEDDSELVLERIEEEMVAEDDDSEEDEDMLLHVDDLDKLVVAPQKTEEIMESSTNITEWEMELERAIPHLKLTVRTDNRNWRNHLQQMKQHSSALDEASENVTAKLQNFVQEISKTTEKINNREKYLNITFETPLNELRLVKDELAKVNERYKELSVGVEERQKKLSSLTERLAASKQQVEDWGTKMTDGTPLINVKRAISVMKTDIANMDVQIGVLQHDIFQGKLREKLQMQQNLHTKIYA